MTTTTSLGTALLAPDSRVGDVARSHPLATRVFARHGIDYCCGGGRKLDQVCADKGLDTTAVLDEIRHELASTGAADIRHWDEAPLGELVDHILVRFHQPLYEELPRLQTLARKVASVHGDKDPRLSQLLEVFLGLQAELEMHMMKEEHVLFPMIREGYGRNARDPVTAMEDEHDVAATALRRLRALTDDYRVPAAACNSWRALWHGLEALETAMHEHIHLENNILFPRALAG